MKIKMLICKLLFIVFITGVQAKEYKIIHSLPQFINQVDVPQISELPEDISGGFYYLLIDEQRVLQDEKVTKFTHYAYKVLNANGVEYNSQLSIDFDPSFEKVVLHKLQVIRNDKMINYFDLCRISVLQRETSLDYQIYDGRKTINIILDDIRVDDIIEYSYSIVGLNPVFHSKYGEVFYLKWSVPVEKVNYEIYSSANLEIEKYNFIPEIDFHYDTDNSTRIKCRASKVKAVNYDDYVPSWYDPNPHFQISHYHKWKDVAVWAHDLYKTKEIINGEIKSKVKNIIGGDTNKERQIINLLRYVQSNIRYLGIEIGEGAYGPSLPEEVYQRKFGDCKDKSLLLVMMLREIGIEAYPALVNTYLKKRIFDYLPSPNLFNHVIVMVKLDDREIWIDPTITNQNGMLGYFDGPDYGYALVISENTEKLTKISDREITGPEKYVFEKYTLSDRKTNSARLEVKTTSICNEAESLRSIISAYSESELKKDYLNYYADIYPYIDSVFFVHIDDEEENRIELLEKYHLNNIWQSDENGASEYFEIYLKDLNSYITIPGVIKRTMPLQIIYPNHLKYEYQINLPQGTWNFKDGIKTIENNAVYFKRETKFNKKNNQLNITFIYKTLKDHVPVNEFNQYKKDMEEIRYHLSLTINKNNKNTNLIHFLYIILFTIFSLIIIILFVRVFHPAFLDFIFKRLYKLRVMQLTKKELAIINQQNENISENNPASNDIKEIKKVGTVYKVSTILLFLLNTLITYFQAMKRADRLGGMDSADFYSETIGFMIAGVFVMPLIIVLISKIWKRNRNADGTYKVLFWTLLVFIFLGILSLLRSV